MYGRFKDDVTSAQQKIEQLMQWLSIRLIAPVMLSVIVFGDTYRLCIYTKQNNIIGCALWFAYHATMLPGMFCFAVS